MGGSGRWTYHGKKRTVEECWAMSISEVDRVFDFSKPGSFSHLFGPTIPKTGKRMSPVRCMSKLGGDGEPLLGLSYTVKDRQGLEHRVEEVLRLQTPPPAKSGDTGENGAPMPVVAELLQRLCGTLASTNMLVIPQTKANSATTTWAVPTIVKDRRSAAVSIRSVGKIAARMLPTTNA